MYMISVHEIMTYCSMYQYNTLCMYGMVCNGMYEGS